MSILHALFVPTGRLRGKPYWLGAGILLLVAVFIQFLSYWFVVNSENMQGMMMASIGSMLLWLLIYPYFCLYGKRLRDMGVPATWFILIIFVYAIVNWIAQSIVMMPVMFEEMGGMIEEMESLSKGQDGEIAAGQFSEIFDAQMKMQQGLMKKIMLPTLFVGAIVTAVFDIIVGMLQPKDEGNPFLDTHDLIH